MTAVYLDNRLAHYEVIGRRGQPIIFLHSWLGSWRYWLPTMDHISERYRAYALDFWGFGESDRRPSDYTLTEYVTMLFDFIDNLGLTRVNLVGHGMGGMVAVQAAVIAATERPGLFPKLMVVNTPIQGSRIHVTVKANPLERLLGRSNPTNVWAKVVQKIEVDDREVHKEIVEDTEGLSEELVTRVTESVISTDLRDELIKLQSPLLAVFGERDPIVSPDQGNALREDHAFLQQALRLPKASHFPFLDQPNVFNRLLQDFLASESSDKLEMKKEWRRRVSQLDYM